MTSGAILLPCIQEWCWLYDSLVGTNMNNIQFFDEMNIMQTEKTKRIKMSGSLQSKIERVFKWAGSFDDLLFYFVLCDR